MSSNEQASTFIRKFFEKYSLIFYKWEIISPFMGTSVMRLGYFMKIRFVACRTVAVSSQEFAKPLGKSYIYDYTKKIKLPTHFPNMEINVLINMCQISVVPNSVSCLTCCSSLQITKATFQRIKLSEQRFGVIF